MTQKYLEAVKWFFVAVFVIAAIQAGLVSFDIYSPSGINPLGVLKVLVVVGCVGRAVKKFNFTPMDGFLCGALLFIPTFLLIEFMGPKFSPDLAAWLKVLRLIVFAAANFILYGFVGSLTAIAAKKNA